MTKKTIIVKTFINKKTRQHSLTLSRKKLKAINPKLKFNECLFVKLEIFNKKRGEK